MRVAAGLDSLVLGEPQILGQIARALQTAQDEGSADLLLKRLFQQAIHAGKRVRSETGIARNPTSIAGVAVKLASENLPRLSSMQVTVLGAGETASLVVGALRHRGVENLQVLNRTLRHAQELTELWGGDARSLESLPVALQSSDLVISSVESYQPIIQTGAVAEAMQFRPRRRLTLIDIGVPRNVEPGTAKIPNVSLHNMDTLQTVLSYSMDLRKKERPHVENILAEEVDEFREYLQTYQVLPLITDLYEHAESIRKSELEKSLRRMKNLSEAEQANVEAMTRAIVKKILHTPTVNLRAASKTPRVAEYAAFIRELFGLK
jgi:glutamyl-tRNA reductase